MARPRPIEESEFSAPSPVTAVGPHEPDDVQMEAAKQQLGHIALVAIPSDTYRKIEEAAAERGMRTAELFQLALVEYIQQHPPIVKKE